MIARLAHAEGLAAGRAGLHLGSPPAFQAAPAPPSLSASMRFSPVRAGPAPLPGMSTTRAGAYSAPPDAPPLDLSSRIAAFLAARA